MTENVYPIGHKIVEVREMTEDEIILEGWEDLIGHSMCVALVLDDGSILYASRDEEGNGPGEIFGLASDGTPFTVITPEVAKMSSVRRD